MLKRVFSKKEKNDITVTEVDADSASMADAATPVNVSKHGAVACQPTRVLYIAPHMSTAKQIQVLDATEPLLDMYNNGQAEADFKKQAKLLCRRDAASWQSSMVYSFQKLNKIGSKFTMHHGDFRAAASTDDFRASSGEKTVDSQQEIAYWKSSWNSTSSTHFTFPAGAAHSSHPIKMTLDSCMRRAETFVLDSVSYHWKCDSRMTECRWALIKDIGGRKVEAAKYVNVWTWGTGGVLIVDEREVDPVIATLTCAAILKKVRKRIAEMSSYGAGGP